MNDSKPEENKDLYQALIKSQILFPEIKKNRTVNFGNVRYKYADFDTLIQAVRPILNKNGLFLTQPIKTEENNITFVETKIVHQSGQSISSKLEIKLPADPKQAGAIISYFKRYCLESTLGISTNEDTDATVSRETEPKKAAPKAVKNAASGAKSSTITEAQRKRLFAIAGEKKLGKEQMEPLLKGFGFDSSKDVTKAAYEKVIAAIESYDSASS